VIPLKPKPIPFSIVSSSDNIFESNSNFNRNNLVMQKKFLVDCPFMLPLWQISKRSMSL
jgi:hypothetical protein